MTNKSITCKYCGSDYRTPTSANFIYFCPQCHKYNGFECEKGYGPITPCHIYLGDRQIARIEGDKDYRLKSVALDIDEALKNGTYSLDAYEEAIELISKKLSSLE